MESIEIDFPGRTATVKAKGVAAADLAAAVNAVDEGRFKASVR